MASRTMTPIPVWRFIYFAQHLTESKLKIGSSKWPFVRVKQQKAQMLGVLPMNQRGYSIRPEMDLHRKFRRYLIGAEWYEDVPAIRDYIIQSGAYRNLLKFDRLFVEQPRRKNIGQKQVYRYT